MCNPSDLLGPARVCVYFFVSSERRNENWTATQTDGFAFWSIPSICPCSSRVFLVYRQPARAPAAAPFFGDLVSSSPDMQTFMILPGHSGSPCTRTQAMCLCLPVCVRVCMRVQVCFLCVLNVRRLTLEERGHEKTKNHGRVGVWLRRVELAFVSSAFKRVCQ